MGGPWAGLVYADQEHHSNQTRMEDQGQGQERQEPWPVLLNLREGPGYGVHSLALWGCDHSDLFDPN
jgi:hypothetical protein